MAKFLNFFMLITFAYVMVKFYDSSIPGIGYSLKGFINGGAQQLVDLIGTDSANSILSTLQQAETSQGPGMMSTVMNPYNAIILALIQVLLAGLSALISVIIAYGAVASAIVGLLGPIFIPFLVFEKLEFLFWGWLRAFLAFSFYKVVVAATLSVLSQLLAYYYAMMSGFTDPARMVEKLPVLILLVIVNGFILLKIPAMTATIFSGHVGGHDAGTGIVRREESISGGTGTGKTTLLNILANAIPEHERVVVIEDTSELRIQKPNLLAVECQTDTFKSAVTFDDLLKSALRWRPDRIILGEVRGTEARMENA